jgi:hypothetical protein
MAICPGTNEPGQILGYDRTIALGFMHVVRALELPGDIDTWEECGQYWRCWSHYCRGRLRTGIDSLLVRQLRANIGCTRL